MPRVYHHQLLQRLLLQLIRTDEGLDITLSLRLLLQTGQGGTLRLLLLGGRIRHYQNNTTIHTSAIHISTINMLLDSCWRLLDEGMHTYIDNSGMQQGADAIDSHQQFIEQPQLIVIDEKWIGKESFLKHQLITCPVCYCIPLDYPKECQKCERIFCHLDYEIIANNQNRCPNCKCEPWEIKKDIHITYKHMFDALILKCILCQGEKTYNTKELIEHLENQHNKFLSDDSILYDYVFINEKGLQNRLNVVQNIEVNFKRKQGLSKFEIAGVGGRVLTVDLKEMTATHHQLGKCKMLKERSKTIRKNHQYWMWIVNIADPDQTEDRVVFYSEELQSLIQKNYQDFERNQRLNEFHMDVRETRYRISFSTRTQTNTYTKVQKTIMRLAVKFR